MAGTQRRRRTLRSKLMLAAVLCLVLPAVLTLMAGDYFTRNIIRAQVVDNEKKSLELTGVYLSSLFDSMIRISNGIMFDNATNLALKEMWQRQRLGQTDTAQTTQDAIKINFFLESIASKMNNVYVTILTTEGRLFSNYTFGLYAGLNSSDFSNAPWMERVKKLAAFEVGWIGPVEQYTTSGEAAHPRLMTIARNLRTSSHSTYAYVIVSISGNQLNQIMQHDIGRQETMLLDAGGNILLSNNGNIGRKFEFADKLSEPSGTSSVRYNGEEFLLSRHDLPYGGYRVVSLRPYKEAVSQIYSVSRLSFAFQIAAVFLFLFLLLYMIRQFTKPVVKLGRIAARVEGGDLSVRSGIRGGDEIGRLGHLFDQMLERIERMIAQITAEQTLKRKAELSMLQAQINPHFLFNILNSIRLRILMKGDGENAELLSSLSGLLRMTIQRQDEFTPLHEELDIVTKYIGLLNFRQVEQAKLEIEAASDSLSVPVPRFFLQPLIENAYLHGLSQEAGRIRIVSRIGGERLTLTVEDDGKGISSETLERLHAALREIRGQQADPASSQFSGIGIANVYERLHLIYGDRCSLSIDSSPDTGTSIRIEIPTEVPETGRKEAG